MKNDKMGDATYSNRFRDVIEYLESLGDNFELNEVKMLIVEAQDVMKKTANSDFVSDYIEERRLIERMYALGVLHAAERYQSILETVY